MTPLSTPTKFYQNSVKAFRAIEFTDVMIKHTQAPLQT